MLEDVISRARPIVEDAQARLPVEAAAAIESVYGDIVNLNNFINKEVDVIENDRTLSDKAKRAARRRVLEQAGRRLEVLKQKRIYADAIEELEKKLADEPVDEDMPLLEFLRESEIRDRLAGMTKEQILSHFGDSLFDGSNPLLIDAILNAPPGFELLSEDILKKLRVVRGKRINPELASEIETLKRLEYMIVKLFNRVRRELDTLRRKELPLSLVNTLATDTASS
jgi:hypothetical protein